METCEDIYCVVSCEKKPGLKHSASAGQRRSMTLEQRSSVASLAEEPTVYAINTYRVNESEDVGEVFHVRKWSTRVGVDARASGAAELLEAELTKCRVAYINLSDYVIVRETYPGVFANCFNKFCVKSSVKLCTNVVCPAAYSELMSQLARLISVHGSSQDYLEIMDLLSRKMVELRLRTDPLKGEPHMFKSLGALSSLADKGDMLCEKLDETIDKMVHLGMPCVQKTLTEFILIFADLVMLFADFSDNGYSMARLTVTGFRIANTFKLLGPIKDSFMSAMRRMFDWIAIPSVSIKEPLNSEEGRVLTGEPHEFSLLPCLSTIIGILTVGGKFSKTACDGVLYSLRAINTLVPATRNFPAFLDWIMTCLPEVVQGWVGYVAPDYVWIHSERGQQFQEWVTKVEELCAPLKSVEIMSRPSLQNEVRVAHEMGVKLMEELAAMDRLSPVVGGLYRSAFEKIGTLHANVLHRLGMGPRTEPFHLSIVGPARIGKSHLAIAAAQVLSPLFNEDGEPIPENERIYSMNPNAETLDGYHNQRAVILDDLLQCTDGLDAIKVIQMVGITELIAKFASMDNPTIGVKGTRFTSQVIVSTSNVAYPDRKSVV